LKSVPNKDYYAELGVEESASKAEIDRQFRRQAAKHHPDRGGNEERMKALNEAYSILRNHTARRDYDRSRRYAAPVETFVPVTQPTARDVGVFGYCLSALLCLIAGLFLLLLVRFQWMWFLWPLVILAVFVLGCGVLMARSAMRAFAGSLPNTSRLKHHTGLHELAFWGVILTGIYGLYLLLE
jgi:curved DNA-binding protein CbpA